MRKAGSNDVIARFSGQKPIIKRFAGANLVWENNPLLYYAIIREVYNLDGYTEVDSISNTELANLAYSDLIQFQSFLFAESKTNAIGLYRKPTSGFENGRVINGVLTRTGNVGSVLDSSGQITNLLAGTPAFSRELKSFNPNNYNLFLRPPLTNLFRNSEPATDPGQGTRLDVSFVSNDWEVGLNGKVIFSNNLTTRRYVNVASLPIGTYTICFLAKRTDNGVVTFRSGSTGADISAIMGGSTAIVNPISTHWKDNIYLCQAQRTTTGNSALFGPNKATGESANSVEVSAIMILTGAVKVEVEDYVATVGSSLTRNSDLITLSDLISNQITISQNISYIQSIEWQDLGSDKDLVRFQDSLETDQITLRMKTGGNLVLCYLNESLVELGTGLPSGQIGIIGFTYDGAILKFYVNGSLDSSVYISGLLQIDKIIINSDPNKAKLKKESYGGISALSVSDSVMIQATNGKFLEYKIPSIFNPFFTNKIFRNTGGVYSTDYNFDTIPNSITGSACYIDPVNGNNTNTGNESNPFESVNYAIGQAFNIFYLRRGRTFDYSNGIFGTIFKNIKILPYGTGADPIVSTEIPLTFTPHESLANVFQATNPETTIDIGMVSDALDVDVFNRPKGLTLMSSDSEVAGLAGSFYYSNVSKILYVRTFDNREPDADLVAYLNVKIVQLNETLNSVDKFIYAKDIDFRGGEPVNIFQLGTNSYRFGFDNCHFDYAGVKDGFFFSGTGNGYLKDCISNHNIGDGFNYRSSTVGFAFEFNCKSWFSQSSIANNGSTSHNDMFVIRVGGDYQFHSGKAIQDVENSKTLSIGCIAGNGTAITDNNIPYASDSSESGNTEMWIIDCKTVDNITRQSLWNFDTSTMYVFDGIIGNLIEIGRPTKQNAGSTLIELNILDVYK